MEAESSFLKSGKESRDYRFPRREKLKGRKEIREVFNRRKSVSCPGARLFMHKNGLTHNRIAFTFSRKYGNAAERNRSRRFSREAYRHLRNELGKGHDLVLLVYCSQDDFSARMNQLLELFTKAGLLES